MGNSTKVNPGVDVCRLILNVMRAVPLNDDNDLIDYIV